MWQVKFFCLQVVRWLIAGTLVCLPTRLAWTEITLMGLKTPKKKKYRDRKFQVLDFHYPAVADVTWQPSSTMWTHWNSFKADRYTWPIFPPFSRQVLWAPVWCSIHQDPYKNVYFKWKESSPHAANSFLLEETLIYRHAGLPCKCIHSNYLATLSLQRLNSDKLRSLLKRQSIEMNTASM